MADAQDEIALVQAEIAKAVEALAKVTRERRAANRPLIVGQRDPHALVGPEDRGRNELGADRGEIHEHRLIPVDHDFHLTGDPDAPCAPRASLIERRWRGGICR